MATYNRVQVTRHCLEYLERAVPPEASVRLFLCDASSSDGTADVVLAFTGLSPTVIRRGHDTFWAQGMRVAWEAAAGMAPPPNHYLLLNDDTVLYVDAISRLLEAADATASAAIVVGTLQDGVTGAVTYGGLRRSEGLNPLKFHVVVPPAAGLTEVDTHNGNVVLVPDQLFRRIGFIDAAFTHAMADYDYGLRARHVGARVVVPPGFFGSCSRNSISGTWVDPSLPLRTRRRRLNSVKALPRHEWLLYCRRHGGATWPISFVGPYARILRDTVTR